MAALRKYVTVVRAHLAISRQFATNFAAQVVTLPITMVILIYIYRLLAPEGRMLGPYSAASLSLYFIGVAVTAPVVYTAGTAMWQSWQDINNGDLVNYLCRPVDYLWLRYSRTLANTLVYAICAVGVQGVVQAILGAWSPLGLLQFFVALLLGYSNMFMFWFLAGAVSFWWERPFTARDMVWSLLAIFSGQIIPVDLLQPALQKISRWLPFQGIMYTPARIFAGTLPPDQAWLPLGHQLLWLVVLTVLARALWQVGVRTYDGRGG